MRRRSAKFNDRPDSGERFYRRSFLRHAAGPLAGACLASSGCAYIPDSRTSAIPQRVLGKTGQSVSIVGLGGWHVGRIRDERVGLRIISRALDLGVNFIETAWNYQEGVSERRVAIAIKDRRQQVFLMSKVLARDRQGASAQLEESLNRLGTDYLDLWQFHSVREIEEVDQIFGAGGAMEAASKAREAGKIRYLGITGHYNPAVLEHALKYHQQFDTIQMPINCVDPSNRLSFSRTVLGPAVRLNLGIVAMKSLAMGRIAQRDVARIDQALSFVWSQPVGTVVVGCDHPDHVEKNIGLALAFKPMSAKEQAALIAATAPFSDAEVEFYKQKRL